MIKATKIFLIIRKVYQVQKAAKLKAVIDAKMAWSHWLIAYRFKVNLMKRFNTRHEDNLELRF